MKVRIALLGAVAAVGLTVTTAVPANAATVASSGVRENFDNEPDTDPALPANREWGRAILARAAASSAPAAPYMIAETFFSRLPSIKAQIEI